MDTTRKVTERDEKGLCYLYTLPSKGDLKGITLCPYDGEAIKRFSATVKQYALRRVYCWECSDWDDDRGDSYDRTVYFEEIPQSRWLICENQVVGVVLVSDYHHGSLSQGTEIQNEVYNFLFFGEKKKLEFNRTEHEGAASRWMYTYSHYLTLCLAGEVEGEKIESRKFFSIKN